MSDLAKLGFGHAVRVVGAGQPPYDPADLLKLYLYGYLNQIRSSRRLEREAGRNIELMWLLGELVPGYRTIAKFRAENAAPLRQVNRDFVLILRQLGLVAGTLVAIDGAFFDGSARLPRRRRPPRQQHRPVAADAHGVVPRCSNFSRFPFYINKFVKQGVQLQSKAAHRQCRAE
jgi:hypothetical protein